MTRIRSYRLGDGSPDTTIDDDTQYVDVSGNLSPALVEPSATAAGSFSAGHVYSDNLPKTVTVTVTDNGGLSTTVSRLYLSHPNLSTTGTNGNVTLGTTVQTLTDTVDLTNAYEPTGSLTFSLYENGGTSPVYSETDPVDANGTYTTLNGYTLPTTGAVAGSYQWDVTYNGDPNNNPTSDNNDPNDADGHCGQPDIDGGG